MKSISLLPILLFFSVPTWGNSDDFKMRGLCKDIFGLMPTQNIRTAPPISSRDLTESMIIASIVQLKNMRYNVDRDFLVKTTAPSAIVTVLKEVTGLDTDVRKLVDASELKFRKTWRQYVHLAQQRSAQKYFHLLIALDRYERIENDTKAATTWSNHEILNPAELLRIELALETFRETLGATEKLLFDQTANYYASFSRWHLPELQGYIHFRTGSSGGELLTGIFEKMRADSRVVQMMIRFVPDRADPVPYYIVKANPSQKK